MELIRAGYDSHTAIDKIYEAYNHRSVTHIINAMRKDKINGGHPLLRVQQLIFQFSLFYFTLSQLLQMLILHYSKY